MESFINELAEEVQKRLQALDMKGRCITLKVNNRLAQTSHNELFLIYLVILFFLPISCY